MFVTVGSSFINLVGVVTAWLTTNFIGGMYMFFILMLFFSVIFHLGGKNK